MYIHIGCLCLLGQGRCCLFTRCYSQDSSLKSSLKHSSMWNMHEVPMYLEILEKVPFSRYWKAVVFGCNELNSPEGHSTELKLTTHSLTVRNRNASQFYHFSIFHTTFNLKFPANPANSILGLPWIGADWKSKEIALKPNNNNIVEAAELLWSSLCSQGDKRPVDRLQPNREEEDCKEQTATLFIGCYRLSLLTLRSTSGSCLRQALTLYEPADLDWLHNFIYLERMCAQTHTCTKRDSCIS